MALISHDPFAREELHREVVQPFPHETCKNCGGFNSHAKLFSYWKERDDDPRRTKHRIGGAFCSVGCMRSYHGH